VKGTLIKNENGVVLSNYPVSMLDAQGKIIAKSTTSVNGTFVFEDIPRGDYRVVADGLEKSNMLDAPFFVKDLNVRGTSEGSYSYTVKTNIYFDFNSEAIRSEALIVLREIAALYKQEKFYIELKSHTDAIGDETYNLMLSQKRNDRVLAELRRLGLSGDDLEWLSMGNKQPVASNSTAYGRQFNRRIEISLKSNTPIPYEPLQVYIVRPKGTLFSIAKNFETDVIALQALNGLDGGQLNAYAPIRIANPKGLSPNLDMLVELNESIADTRNVYEVKSGETVISIAEKFNIPEELIMEMNSLKSVILTPGQKLNIYVRDF
jgi:outer membrane protein OmpA-like peptidoglycan-associated protein/LysM repeat protein